MKTRVALLTMEPWLAGAKPEDLICYIKPQNTISRLIQKPFISFLQPQPWIPRNPFKEEASTPSPSFKI
jgi:hypothetical protein